MVWLKKEILFILSVALTALSSCDNTSNKAEKEQVNGFSKQELISLFFSQIQNWSEEVIPLIDSLGNEISLIDSTLTFLPYKNDYEPKSFLFTAKDKSAFLDFEENEFLNETLASAQSSYKVWRKNINDQQILDLSIEPHPTLYWLFVVRLRGQE